nr:hypothetical protein [Tanacetum cinerariifolium]
STNEDYCYEQNSCYNSNSFGSDHCQPPQYTVDHPIFDAHNDFLKTQNELLTSQNTIMEQMTQLTSMCELACQIVQKKQEEKRIEEEQAANARYWKIPACCDDDDDYDSAITPDLSIEETDNSLSIRDEHLDTIPATKSDEVIKSSVEDLIPIPSEFEGIPDTMCDVHLDNNHTPLEAKDHVEIVMNSNDDISSSDDDSLHEENIEYVEASPHDSELVSLKAAEIIIPEEEEIEDDNLREKLLNVHLLIANIEALKDNPTPSFELLTKSSSTSLNSLLEETNTFHNSLLEFENFYFDLGEISSGSTLPMLQPRSSKVEFHIIKLSMSNHCLGRLVFGYWIFKYLRDNTSHDNSPPLDVSKDQIEDFSESNKKFSSIDDDSFSIDDIDYVEASPPDSELVSSEVMEIVIPKTKSSSTYLTSLLEETNTFDNSLPEFKTFCFDVEEISSGSTTTSPDISLPEYEVFHDDHVKEISSGSPTTHSDSPLYASFMFDLSINPFPPADRKQSSLGCSFVPFLSPLIRSSMGNLVQLI